VCFLIAGKSGGGGGGGGWQLNEKRFVGVFYINKNRAGTSYT